MQATSSSIKERIIAEINAHMRNCGGANSAWYVGVASSAEERLFNDHSVDRTRDSWIYRRAASSSMARDIEQAYLDAGCDGGPGGGDAGTIFVYAYRKTRTTNP